MMYADDTKIYFNIENFVNDNIEISVNSELEKVNVWLQHNKLSLNNDKTKCMIFHTLQRNINPTLFNK